MILFGVRDTANRLIHWFNTKKEAKEYIELYDSEGSKGYHIIKID